MKKMVLMLLLFLTLGNTVWAAEAETPMQAYVRNGVEYSMYSVPMQELVPEYDKYLKLIAKELFGEEPPIFVYAIDERMQDVYGFQTTFEDGSKAIYINGEISYKKGVQVFIHEMVHYAYNVQGNIMYEKYSYGGYKYPELMEVMTDIIAKDYYRQVTDKEYQPAKVSKVLNQIIQEDESGILISLYKNEINIKADISGSIYLLNTAIKTGDYKLAKQAYEELKVKSEEDFSLFIML